MGADLQGLTNSRIYFVPWWQVTKTVILFACEADLADLVQALISRRLRANLCLKDAFWLGRDAAYTQRKARPPTVHIRYGIIILPSF